MWEFTAADDPDLGKTFSEPAVVPLGTSSGIEWYVVVGNGYESTHTDASTHPGDDGNPYAAKLFLIKLEGPGVDGVWDIGTDYYKMDTQTPAGATVGTNRNGMSSPALADNDGDGIFDRAYAGDLLGNLWAMDLSGDPANNNEGWPFAYKSGSTPNPLFIASDGDAGAGNRQPITMRPALGRHPSVATVDSGGGANLPNIMVYFGTGQYLTTDDLTNTDTQSFYAVWDRGDDNRTVNRSSPLSSDNHLQKQTIVETTIAVGAGTENVRYIDPDTNGDTTVDSADNIDFATDPQHGWYIDLPTNRERSIFNPLLRGGMVFFNTLIPSSDPCGFGGSGWIMAANQNDGKSPSEPLLDANRNGTIGAGDTVGGVAITGQEVTGGIPGGGALISAGGGGGGPGPTPPPCDPPKRPHVEVVLDSSGTAHTVNMCLTEGAKIGRYSWRELSFD
jgi:type IV pilus assembly protein PilY1